LIEAIEAAEKMSMILKMVVKWPESHIFCLHTGQRLERWNQKGWVLVQWRYKLAGAHNKYFCAWSWLEA
jgi:hypothetical protein